MKIHLSIPVDIQLIIDSWYFLVKDDYMYMLEVLRVRLPYSRPLSPDCSGTMKTGLNYSLPARSTYPHQ